ncbi:hypothetical protein Q8A73_002861 [Channa argus]|nr:hypothetical protein Q8A73_002861 [Channa argus]
MWSLHVPPPPPPPPGARTLRLNPISQLAGSLSARTDRFPTARERSRSPPSQFWLNVTRRLGAERGFLAELRSEQEPSWSSSFVRLPRFGHGTGGYGSISVLLLFSPLRDVPPSDAPVPIEEEAQGASLSFFDHQGGEEEEEEEEGVGGKRDLGVVVWWNGERVRLEPGAGGSGG